MNSVSATLDRSLKAVVRGAGRSVIAGLAIATLAGPMAAAQMGPPTKGAAKPVVGPKPARLADGHPNWTGFWVPRGGLLEVNIGLGGTPPMDPSHAPPPPPPLPFNDFPPLKSPYKEQHEAFLRKMMTTGAVDDPVAACFPPGMPRMMVMAYGMELLQAPGEISITSEWQTAQRHIWLDRATHPAGDDLDPSYAGDSIGHWEGDTLVVDTVGIRDDVPLNFAGLPHSPKLHVVERMKETPPGILVDDMTIEDPDVFVTPWHTRQIYRYRPDLRIEEFVCLENNRNVGQNGEATFKK